MNLSTGRTPWGLLGTVALMAVVEFFAGRSSLQLAPVRDADWIRAERVATHRARAAEFLVLGDSMTKVGVLPMVLSHATGQRGYSLAVVGGQAPSTYFLLKKALDSGAKPRRVVVNFLPSLLSRDYTYDNGQWPMLLGVRDGLDLAWHARDAGLLARIWLGDLLPSCRGRGGLRTWLKASLDGGDEEMRVISRGHLRNWSQNRGAMVLAGHFQSKVKVEDWYRVDFPRPWEAVPINTAYLSRFLDLAASRGIAVQWLVTPLRGSTRAILARHCQEARYLDYVREWAARYPNVEVVDARDGFDDGHFVDPVHLNREGARLLSGRLALTFARPPRPGAWTPLPAAGVAAEVAVEDLHESVGLVR